MFKKLVSTFLLMTLMSLFTSPLGASVNANSEKLTLKDFLKTTEDISAVYTYPSMKLSVNGTGKTKLSANTPIVVKCDETISSSQMLTGSTVRFSVLGDVKDTSGKILIKSGTPATAQISFSKSKGMLGKSGELTISDFHTTAVDGTYIPLSGTVSAKPDDKMVTSVVLGVVVCALFLMMKGEDAVLPAETTKTMYTMSETYINSLVR